MYGERSQLPLPVRYFITMERASLKKVGLLCSGLIIAVAFPQIAGEIDRKRQGKIREEIVTKYNPIVTVVREGEAMIFMKGPTSELNGSYLDRQPYGSLDGFLPSLITQLDDEQLDDSRKFYARVYSNYLRHILRN